MHKILFAASEASPLAKTGGLGEVCGALPVALQRMGVDVRMVLPGYRSVLEQSPNVRVLAHFNTSGSLEPVRILESTLGTSAVPLYIIDAPGLFNRPGGLYATPEGGDWPDNANRYTVFCRAIVELAMNRAGMVWQPDVVHCHDWQTGLVPALLVREAVRPGTVFTVHNIAYIGGYDRARFDTLQLPTDLFRPEGMEFHGRFAFIKGGLVFADVLTTVSPTYAQEIQTPQYGCGLDGLIRHRAADLTGIINGVDDNLWDPRTDTHIVRRYDVDTLDEKIHNKHALQRELQLEEQKGVLLLGVVSRFAHQKGIDLLPEALAPLWRDGVQLTILGSGDTHLERMIGQMAAQHRGSCGVYIGYNDPLSHRIMAGADALLMPSRYEPCGLGQLYGQRYGTVPIVRSTGGLADTVTPTRSETVDAGVGTGLIYHEDSATALSTAVHAAIHLFHAPEYWRQIQVTGMQRDFSWNPSARAYIEVYRRAQHYHR